jgi:Kef-type K+ transport system membrane component KefB
MENNQIKTHKWVVKSVSIISDIIFVIVLIWFGIYKNFFNLPIGYLYISLIFVYIIYLTIWKCVFKLIENKT